MISNAALYSAQLAEKFGESYYTDRMFHFNGGVFSKIPDFTPEAYKYKYAVINSKGDVVGYISYHIDTTSLSAEDFKLINFTKRSTLVGVEFKNIFESLLLNKSIRRIMINCASGSPFIKTFDEIFDNYRGDCLLGYNRDLECNIESYRCSLHESIADSHGELHDEEIYEFLIRR